MAIRPVASVSFRNNYNQTNFEGKRHKENSEHRHASTPLKAVPLAALVAMSPLCAEAQLEYNIPKTASNSLIVDYTKDKELGYAEVPLGNDYRKSAYTGMLLLYDSDKDYSTCEKAAFLLSPKDPKKYWCEVAYINKLRIEHNINSVTGEDTPEYHLVGRAGSIRDPYNVNGLYKLRIDSDFMRVSKETFDEIKEIFGGDCPLEEKTIKVNPGTEVSIF